jgi:hypothetical protein
MRVNIGNNDLRISGKITWLVSTVSLLSIISFTGVSSLPNIRIQVNSENLQNPPYLLDALKQVEKTEQKAAAAAASVTANQNAHPPESFASGQDSAIQAQAQPRDPITSANDERNYVAAASSDDSKSVAPNLASADEMSSIGSGKGDTILEEMADLDAESEPKPFSASLAASSVVSSEPVQGSTLEAGNNNNRHFQLDVTSSHLKRPSMVMSSELVEDELSGESSSPGATETKQHQAGETANIGPGAKSHVSPSVANDDGPATGGGGGSQLAKLGEKTAASPPDTWEPNQVMQGVTNASLVPATVRRHYGHQTRTRITLGGGYQREQQAPLASPPSSSSDYVDNKPEKLPKPSDNSAHEHQSAGSSLDNSRVIEIPERIVLPDSVFTKQHDQVSKNTTTTPVQQVARRRDTRCPSNGVTSLEHPTACDKYFLCENGYSSEQVCPNGLMYGTRDIVRDYCVHRWQVVCGDKSIPNPISSPGCRWQNGIFSVQGSPKCTPDFYECTDGSFEVKKCSISGQVYDDKTKSCQYAEQVGCAQEALADFQCPPDDQSNTYWPFPRYFLNERALIHCVSDKPQIIRCRDHERVDPEHLFCVPIDKSAPRVNEDGTVETVVSARREKSKKIQAKENR